MTEMSIGFKQAGSNAARLFQIHLLSKGAIINNFFSLRRPIRLLQRTIFDFSLLMKMFRSIRHKVRRNKVLVEGSFVDENASADVAFEDYIQHERKKPNLNDFTLSEYTEKGK